MRSAGAADPASRSTGARGGWGGSPSEKSVMHFFRMHLFFLRVFPEN